MHSKHVHVCNSCVFCIGAFQTNGLTPLYNSNCLASVAVLFVDVGNNHFVLDTLGKSFVRSCTLPYLPWLLVEPLHATVAVVRIYVGEGPEVVHQIRVSLDVFSFGWYLCRCTLSYKTAPLTTRVTFPCLSLESVTGMLLVSGNGS